jgi:aminoglycoside 6'-N-acetyltransferase I
MTLENLPNFSHTLVAAKQKVLSPFVTPAKQCPSMVSPLRDEDRAEWLRMRKQLWPDCPDEMHAFEVAQQTLAADNAAVLVFRRPNGQLGGFVELSIRDRVDGSMSERVGYVEGWFVDADLRGAGVGRQLIAAAEQWTLARGLTEIASDAELDNDASIRAHHAVGFRETFRLVHFLKPLRRDADEK